MNSAITKITRKPS